MEFSVIDAERNDVFLRFLVIGWFCPFVALKSRFDQQVVRRSLVIES